MRKILWIGALFLSFGVAHAAVTYTTSTGAVFTQVQGPGNSGLAWKDPSGIVWSAYIGDFNNQPTQSIASGSYSLSDSAAMEACQALGAYLPPVGAYDNLLTYFEHGSGNWGGITAQGQKDLFALFPDMQREANSNEVTTYPTETLSYHETNVEAGLLISAEVSQGAVVPGALASILTGDAITADDGSQHPVHCIDWTPVPSPAWKIVVADETSQKFCATTGSVIPDCTMTYQNAMAYCESQGMHVPTAREAALYMANLTHVVGVTDNGSQDNGWVSGALNPDGTVDNFYFNGTGFIAPDNPGLYQFWTSSQLTGDRTSAFLFDSQGLWGVFAQSLQTSDFGVVCVAP